MRNIPIIGMEKLVEYVNEGRKAECVVGGELVDRIPIDPTKFLPLNRKSYRDVHGVRFAAVDCSTYPLKRANNWGIYLLRTATVLIEPPDRREIYPKPLEKPSDSLVAIVGGSHMRRDSLKDWRMEFESEAALKVLHKLREGDYLFLDGVSHFGAREYRETRRFRIELYNECERSRVVLITLSKNSPSLLDDKGRSFFGSVSTSALPSFSTWAYPAKPEDRHENLYGNVFAVKLSTDDLRIFRCDLMEYLTEYPIRLISPLTSLAEDPRCEGYPAPLYLADEETSVPLEKRLERLEEVEGLLREVGVKKRLDREEAIEGFGNQIHFGKRHPLELGGADLV